MCTVRYVFLSILVLYIWPILHFIIVNLARKMHVTITIESCVLHNIYAISAGPKNNNLLDLVDMF